MTTLESDPSLKKDISALKPSEHHLLMDLIHERKETIENKEKDACTNAAKAKAWRDITQAFNSDGGVTRRDTTKLKRLV